MKNRKAGFIASVSILIAGMTAGFILLGLVYDGPRWISFIVFVAYLFVMYFTVKASRSYIRAIDSMEDGNDREGNQKR